jgi:starch phosphorylase
MDRRGAAMEDKALFKRWGIFRKGMNANDIQLSFADHLEYSLSKDEYTATPKDLYTSMALTARDRMIEQWIQTQQAYYDNDVKRVYYLSAEYLMGRALINNLINMGMYEQTKTALKELSLDLDELAEQEPDAGLGNGGLGRLAACFLDSMATLDIPAYGYGISYEFGIFEQVIRDLGQFELPDRWLKHGNPWGLPRPERTFTVKFCGKVIDGHWPDGRLKAEWIDTDDVIGLPYDTPVAGYSNRTVNTLRLWSARASKDFDLGYFQHGNYLKAVEEKNLSENISKVLYPNDASFGGQELRLKQQYFFVSCSIQDIIRRYLVTQKNFDQFPDKVAIQMNDTHPSLAIVELMRLLLDEHQLDWGEAWDITSRTCAYTNHTVLAEALEEWSLSMFVNLLPRHLQIIYEINRRFLRDVSVRYVGDNERAKRMSIIKEGEHKKIRMANLAIIGSHSVNGVAELHTRLLREDVFREFDEIFPGRIINITNGMTPRRWLLVANPGLAGLITEHIGKEWVKDLNQLNRLESLAEDSDFQEQFNRVKRDNKGHLAALTRELTGFSIDPDSIFDVQVKRIHEYKRQLLNILHIIHCWLRIKEEPGFEIHPRTFLFGGKTAPDYFLSKQVIRLICHVAEMVNSDPETSGMLKVVFLPNYRVTLAERIIPAADVSEQISTAGYEASGTGNMKLALNGALTVGTRDGANIEIMEEVGRENIFIFGMNADEVKKLRSSHDPYQVYQDNPHLKEVIDLISNGFFSPEDPETFHPLIDSLIHDDPYMVLADFEDYRRCQKEVNDTYKDRWAWTKKAILNVAHMSKFSSDRTILDYNGYIWHAQQYHIPEVEKEIEEIELSLSQYSPE